MKAKIFGAKRLAALFFAGAVFSGCFPITIHPPGGQGGRQESAGEDEAPGILLDPGEPYPVASAAFKCDAEGLGQLLKIKDFDINTRDEGGRSALMHAAGQGCPEGIAKLLLDAGADPNLSDRLGRTALIWAAESRAGGAAFAGALLKAGADPNAKTEKTQAGALVFAARKNKPQLISALLAADGIEVNALDKNEKTALIHAAGKGSGRAIELLLPAGADPNLKDYRGRTALMFAAKKGRTAPVQALLAADGIDAGAHDKNGWTALFYAVEKGHSELIPMLAGAGAGAAHKDFNERTALMTGAASGEPDSVRELLKLQAARDSINEADSDGKTAFALAEEEGYQTIAGILRDAGADTSIGRGAFLGLKGIFKKLFKKRGPADRRVAADGAGWEGKAQAGPGQRGGAEEVQPEGEKKSFFQKAADFFKSLF